MNELLLESAVEGGGADLPAAVSSPPITRTKLGEALVPEVTNPRKGRTSFADGNKAVNEREVIRWAGLIRIDAPADSANDGSIAGATDAIAAAA